MDALIVRKYEITTYSNKSVTKWNQSNVKTTGKKKETTSHKVKSQNNKSAYELANFLFYETSIFGTGSWKNTRQRREIAVTEDNCLMHSSFLCTSHCCCRLNVSAWTVLNHMDTHVYTDFELLGLNDETMFLAKKVSVHSALKETFFKHFFFILFKYWHLV